MRREPKENSSMLRVSRFQVDASVFFSTSAAEMPVIFTRELSVSHEDICLKTKRLQAEFI